MKFLVLGAGMMGRAAAADLARSSSVSEVLVADIDKRKALDVKGFINSAKVKTASIDVTDFSAVVRLMRGFDAAIGAVSYRYNFELARAAIEAGVNFCDLGGNNSIVEKEFSLDEEAKRRGITIIPDCGLAPGITNILAAEALGRFDETYEIHIRVGGLPQNPTPPLNYKILFSPEGLINEYKEDAYVIRGGELRIVRPMTDIEEIEFPPPFGRLEAFNTSGGVSTLPKTLLGKVKELDYKTIRYPGHCALFKTMLDLGLADERPLKIEGVEVVPRRVFEKILLNSLGGGDKDVVLLRLCARGRKDGRTTEITYNITDYYDEKNSLSAMMRMTAFPASIIAQMMASGKIRSKGVLAQELSVPPAEFIAELQKRGVNLRTTLSEF